MVAEMHPPNANKPKRRPTVSASALTTNASWTDALVLLPLPTWCRRRDSNPQEETSYDFESYVYTSSTTPADNGVCSVKKIDEKVNGEAYAARIIADHARIMLTNNSNKRTIPRV